MKIHIIFISIFILLMLTMHVWYAYRDYGKWPWRSKKFWFGEAKIAIVFVAIVSAIFIFGGRYKHNSWFWETRAFFACDWGMSPEDVLRVENLTGRPSGTMAPPQLKRFGEQFHTMYAEKNHLYPLTQQKGRSRKNKIEYGAPVYKKSGDMRVLIWDYDDRSYLGLIITVDEHNGQLIKRKIFMDKNLGMESLKLFTDHFLHSPDQTNIL
ncbi:MAG: hypothetical protein JRI64_09630 [Deltaproteobacteria bacterium]|nr:hypothetical protein [Deltaproteobacteria bacterium]